MHDRDMQALSDIGETIQDDREGSYSAPCTNISGMFLIVAVAGDLEPRCVCLCIRVKASLRTLYLSNNSSDLKSQYQILSHIFSACAKHFVHHTMSPKNEPPKSENAFRTSCQHQFKSSIWGRTPILHILTQCCVHLTTHNTLNTMMVSTLRFTHLQNTEYAAYLGWSR